jgi:hypothetical protein
VLNKSKNILYLRFFKVATLCLNDSFSHTLQSLNQLQEECFSNLIEGVPTYAEHLLDCFPSLCSPTHHKPKHPHTSSSMLHRGNHICGDHPFTYSASQRHISWKQISQIWFHQTKHIWYRLLHMNCNTVLNYMGWNYSVETMIKQGENMGFWCSTCSLQSYKYRLVNYIDMLKYTAYLYNW